MALVRAAGPPTRVGHLAQQASRRRTFLRVGFLVQGPTRWLLLGQDSPDFDQVRWLIYNLARGR